MNSKYYYFILIQLIHLSLVRDTLINSFRDEAFDIKQSTKPTNVMTGLNTQNLSQLAANLCWLGGH